MTKVTPARQAERILAAWASGNEPLLHQELRRSRELGCTTGGGLDEERLELLQAASEGLLRKDRTAGRCLDLLAHLAQAPGAAAESN